MEKKYQLIEPDFLYKLDSKITVFELGMISFFVDLLKKETSILSLPISIDLVIANYTGNYPVIGVHYEDETIIDVEAIISELLKKYMSNHSLTSFYDYLVQNQDKLFRDIENLNES